MKNAKAGIFALVVLIGATWSFTVSAELLGGLEPSQNLGLSDAGVGIYTGPSVVNQVTTFTLTKNMVSCGVGTIAAEETGPFEMLMYSLRIDSFDVDRQSSLITATGKMRSTTRVAGLTVEDTNGEGFNPAPHDFIAFGWDNGGDYVDRFEMHFKTPYWNILNPLCTPSSFVAGGCMFGGELFMGEVVVD